MKSNTITAAAIAIAAGAAVLATDTVQASTLVFDRGLPDSNLNNISGGSRSNVAWGYGQNGANLFASGDDFTLAGTGDASNPVWQVDTIRMWITGGAPGDAKFNLAQRFTDAQLFLGIGGGPVSQVQSGNFIAGGNMLDNSNIVITPVQYAGGEDYQGSSGAAIQIWQVDFTNLNLLINPGDLVEFYAFGNAVNPATGAWFNHASNAALSGTPQDGADDLYRAIQINDLTNTFSGIDSNGDGWDKSSDINVQVFATAIPTPGAVALFGLAGLAAARRRRG